MELRRLGHTTYILKAAMHDPNVVICFATLNLCKQFKQQYFALKDMLPWYKRLFLPLGTPWFKTRDQVERLVADGTLKQSKRAVVFDNYTMGRF